MGKGAVLRSDRNPKCFSAGFESSIMGLIYRAEFYLLA